MDINLLAMSRTLAGPHRLTTLRAGFVTTLAGVRAHHAHPEVNFITRGRDRRRPVLSTFQSPVSTLLFTELKLQLVDFRAALLMQTSGTMQTDTMLSAAPLAAVETPTSPSSNPLLL